MSFQENERVVRKIIKKLKSKDDNDKLASLSYLIKIYPTPNDLINSRYAAEIWSSLRSSQFLERALKSNDTKSLVLSILSVFCHVCNPEDLLLFIPILLKIKNDDEAKDTLIEISQCLNDISVLFKYNDVDENNIEFFIKALDKGQKMELTTDVFRNRLKIFNMLNGHEDLKLRRLLFLLLARLCKCNDGIMIFEANGKVNISDFLKSERLAFIELRLQLDLPINYLEIEEKNENSDDKSKIAFTQEIGPLINQEISAASCELLEYLMVPLLNNDEYLSDDDINKYFTCVNSIIEETVLIFKAAKGKRDSERKELKCLLAIFAKWLMEAPFLCNNNILLNSVKNIIQLLCWFPKEALLYLPSIETWCDSKSKQDLKTDFNNLSKCMMEFANDEEKAIIEQLNKIIYTNDQ